MWLQLTTDQGTCEVRISSLPDTCSICGRSAHPKIIAGAVLNGSLEHPDLIQIAMRCPSKSCGKLFVAVYSRGSYREDTLALRSMYPIVPSPPSVAAEISELSEEFVATYSDALASQHYGLHKLTGVGLRRALEFLVKDYAIRCKPDEKQAILASKLGGCLTRFIDDARVKSCAERAAWLGNDETHYVRKWTEHDVEDLMRLIRLTMNWIENALVTDRYEAEMPRPRMK